MVTAEPVSTCGHSGLKRCMCAVVRLCNPDGFRPSKLYVCSCKMPYTPDGLRPQMWYVCNVKRGTNLTVQASMCMCAVVSCNTTLKGSSLKCYMCAVMKCHTNLMGSGLKCCMCVQLQNIVQNWWVRAVNAAGGNSPLHVEAMHTSVRTLEYRQIYTLGVG